MADDAKEAEACAAKPRARWADRVSRGLMVLAILAAGVTVLALVFRDAVRAEYWSWRLTRVAEQGGLASGGVGDPWTRAMVSLGDRSRGPAIRMTRSADGNVRLAGARVLVGIMDQPMAEYRRRVREVANRRDMQFGLPAAPLPDAVIAGRLREMLADPASSVAEQDLLLDELPRLWKGDLADSLLRMASESPSAALRLRATGLLCDCEGAVAGPALRALLARSNDADVRLDAIDGLRDHDGAETREALVAMLSDVRSTTVPPRSQRVDPAMIAAVKAEAIRRGMGREFVFEPSTQPEGGWTVAGYADRALREMTGRDCGFDVGQPAGARDSAIGKWREAIRVAATQGE